MLFTSVIFLFVGFIAYKMSQKLPKNQRERSRLPDVDFLKEKKLMRMRTGLSYILSLFRSYQESDFRLRQGDFPALFGDSLTRNYFEVVVFNLFSLLLYVVFLPCRQIFTLAYVEILVPKTHIDDEYATASERDPKILITTSRNPSAPLTQFVKVGIDICLNSSLLVIVLFLHCHSASSLVSSLIAIIGIFLQELKFVFPNAQRMNRGGQVGGRLCDAALLLLVIQFYFQALSVLTLTPQFIH